MLKIQYNTLYYSDLSLCMWFILSNLAERKGETTTDRTYFLTLGFFDALAYKKRDFLLTFSGSLKFWTIKNNQE